MEYPPTHNEVIVPIVLASDRNYAPFLYVTMLSCLTQKKRHTCYAFYILLAPNFGIEQRKAIQALADQYDRVSVQFIDMGNKFSHLESKIAHISIPTYYRLLISDLLPDEHDKAIYLDTDTIVKEDLSELYITNIRDAYIAGVTAIGYYRNKNNHKRYRNYGIDDMTHYINGGVTLWNLKLIRKQGKISELLSLAEQSFSSMDQDVINIAFSGKIHILPLRYNLMTTYIRELTSDNVPDVYYEIYGKANIADALSSPAIIHYADKNKPWNTVPSAYAAEWWMYAGKIPTTFMPEIFSMLVKNISNTRNELNSKTTEISNLRNQIEHNIKLHNMLHSESEKIQQQVNKTSKNLQLCILYPQLIRQYRITQLKAFFSWGKARRKYKDRMRQLKEHIRSYRVLRRQSKVYLMDECAK